MDKNNFQKKWNEIKSKIKSKWNKITNEDMSEIDGHYDRMISKIQKRHGYSKEQAEREFQNWNMDSSEETSERFGMHSESDREESGDRSESYGSKNSSWDTERERGSSEGRHGFEGERGSTDRNQNHSKNQDQGQKHGNTDRNKQHPGQHPGNEKHKNKDDRDNRGWDEKKRKAG
jgi:uncharacterized protein YjbJ (UPF0337 family)